MMPKLAAHFGAGHLTLIYALTWTPWLISTWKRDSEKEPRRLGIGTAWIFALICLADVRWAMYAAVAWIAYGFAHSHETRRTISRLVLCLTLALLLASPLLLPFIEYTSQSTRWSMTVEDNLAFSLPPERLLGLVFPDLGGYHEWILYTGAIVLSLAVVALCGRANQRETRFWIALGIVALLFSLGSSLPLAEVIARLPGFNLLRVPSRALFLFEMASAVLAAYGFHFVLAGQVKVRFAGLSLAGYAIFAVLLTAGVSMLSGSLPVNFAWGAGVVAFSVLLVSWGLRGLAQKYRAVWMTALFGLLICDLGFVGRSLFVFHPVEQVLAAGEAAGAWLRAQSGVFRVYSPSYSLPQQTAARYNLRLADGVDPLQLERYANFMEKATGVPRHGYSVTLPPLKNGDPHTTNKTYLPDAALLGILNVRYVVADFDLAADGLALRQTFGETRVYENFHFLPPLWIQPVDVLPGEQAQPVSPFERSSNRIAAPVEGPGLLVLSEIIYPGWRVTVDEEEAVLVSVAGILRGVKLDAGRHAVEFVFRPTSLYIGLALCALGVLLSLLLRQKKGAGE
jgi:hypothetical protein